MDTSIHDRIKHLIEQTNEAFTCYGNLNTDYADFASLSLPDFKRVLSDPTLTGRQLRQMLRQGMMQSKNRDPESCWATFMAHYIARTANSNTQNMHAGKAWKQSYKEKS